MNNILKLILNLKPAKIPDLIEMLKKEILLQEALTRGALYGHGDYELANEAVSLKISLSSWQQKQNKKKHFCTKFF